MVDKAKVNTVIVILKVIERCNINCSYCYFFNGIDTSFRKHPARISLDIINNLANYLKEAAQAHGIQLLRFDFHGGEPLLLKPAYLAAICDILKESLSSVTKVEFTLQTNAMLINNDWIELFNRYKINIGISIDGPAEYHDKYRVDHKGRGTYAQVEAGINLLKSYAKKSQINFGIGALSVINPEFSGRKIYRHLVDNLKFTSFDFLLPDNTWSSVKHDVFKATDYSRFLIELFDEWTKDNNPQIYVRILDTLLSKFLNKRLHFHDFGGWIDDFLLITVDSNGGIGPDDTYRSADPNFMQLGLTVKNSSFNDFLNHPTINMLIKSAKAAPTICQECSWVSTCNGGSLLHRYSAEKDFANPSVYCNGLKVIFEYVNHFIQTHEIVSVSEKEPQLA